MPVRRLSGQTGRTHTGGSYAEYAAGPLTRLAEARGMAVPLPDPGDPAEISGAPPIRTVFLHEDRWIAQCPGCARDYSFVWPVGSGQKPVAGGQRPAADGGLYMCPECWNNSQLRIVNSQSSIPSGLYLRAAMPDGWERVDREAGRAPDPRLRNWIPAGAGLKGALASEPEQTAEEVIKEFSRYE